MLDDAEFNDILAELEEMPAELREMLVQAMPLEAQKVLEAGLARHKVRQDTDGKPYMKIRKK